MTKQIQVSAQNTLGKQNRIVVAYTVEATDVREAIQQATYAALLWNKTETRKDMIVNFIVADGMVRSL